MVTDMEYPETEAPETGRAESEREQLERLCAECGVEPATRQLLLHSLSDEEHRKIMEDLHFCDSPECARKAVAKAKDHALHEQKHASQEETSTGKEDALFEAMSKTPKSVQLDVQSVGGDLEHALYDAYDRLEPKQFKRAMDATAKLTGGLSGLAGASPEKYIEYLEKAANQLAA